ncbi:uncharacterized protein [Coffea arabica]
MSQQRFQAAALVASPSYPNAVAWSEENLIAVASGHLVTILNPATPVAPRGLITLPAYKPFPIGVIHPQDILAPCILPTSLSRDARPCVRSISWSPIGYAPNAGCLLAVCSTDGHVKLYRMPCCEYSAEWIEVADISEMFHSYLASVNFKESDVLSSGIVEEQINDTQMDQSCGDTQQVSILKALTVVENARGNLKNNNVRDIVAVPDSRRKHAKKGPEDCNLSLITAEQFASRNSMLASLVVAWSPDMILTAGVEEASADYVLSNCSVLAVGAKSGRISLWRICQPQRYSSTNSRELTTASLIGLFQAHDSWITALSWLHISDASNPQLLLATGSSNGCVKVWQAYVNQLLKSSEVSDVLVSLLKEISTIDSSPASVISFTVPIESTGKLFLAIGRGSGSLEVWIGELKSSNFDKACCPDAHEHIVTGLAWAFGTNCLYSCSQDDTVRCWILHDDVLSGVPLPSNTTGVRSQFDVPNVYDSCFGLALSPGNLAMAAVHSFDTDLLDPMYEARTLKGAIEFLWIGGQQLDLTLNTHPDPELEAFTGLPERELMSWKNNVFWSFNQFEHVNKPLVIWDVVAPFLAFRQSIPPYVEHILIRWMRTFFGSEFEVSPSISSKICKLLSNTTSRQLHMLNVISRCVFLKELKAEQINSKLQDFEGFDGAEPHQSFWLNLVCNIEKELRERLVCFNFLAILRIVSNSTAEFSKSRCWTAVGLGQMVQWVASNADKLSYHVKVLAEKIGKIDKRLRSLCDYVAEERCSFCSAPVPFESTEVAFCEGERIDDGVGQSHKLRRCAVSMMVCPNTPTWFCICCHRYASSLAHTALFTMPKSPLDSNHVSESLTPEESRKPLCPFCGILLQRPQPDFLLSPSPV